MNKILLVEDDPLVARMYQKIFDKNGFDMQIASDGNDGISKTKSIKPDLLIVDLMLPGMNGLEMIDKIKKDDETKDIPVVILTNVSWSFEKEAKSKGVLGYYVKSENKPADFLQKIKKLMSKLPPMSKLPDPAPEPAK